MSFHDRRDRNRPAEGEVPFELREAFYSRTDARGVILAGNTVFQRVSRYDWDRLIGAPHKLVRHPDMPRGVFYLMWQVLKAGQVMAAYVKNRSSDDLFYWVFAVILPYEGGYLSVRIKPSSPLFDKVRALYADLRARENAGELSPEASALALVEALQQMGFADYAAFATAALAQELRARDLGLGQPLDRKLQALSRAAEMAEALNADTGGLIAEFNNAFIMPVNMRIIAARLEPAGGPLSILSNNYGLMSQDMLRWFETNLRDETGNFGQIRFAIGHGLMVHGLARILGECLDQLGLERRRMGDERLHEERLILGRILAEYRRQAEQELRKVRLAARQIRDACQAMDRLVLGLSTTRVLCKIENARVGAEGEGLAGIIAHLQDFQENIKSKLGTLRHNAMGIEASINEAVGHTRPAREAPGQPVQSGV